MLILVSLLHAFTHIYQVALLPLYLPIQKGFGLASVGSSTFLVTLMMAAYSLREKPRSMTKGAVITHRNTITGTDVDGKPFTEYRRSVHVLEKRKGNWQVVSNSGHKLADAGQLYYMELDWNAADMKNDVSWYERNLANDFSSVSSRGGALSDKAGDIADMRSPKRKLASIVLSDFDARMSGNTAVVTGVNHVTGTDDKNQAFDQRVRFTDTFVRRDGRWQVWATQGTLIPDKK